jgi:hypothetical protein
MHIASVGIDLGKTTFHLVAKVLVGKKFSRTQLLAYTTARSESMSAVHRNNDESTFDDRRPQGENKTALDQSKGAMMGDRRVATFFYGSFMDDKILKQLGVVAERSEVAVFVLRHHTRMIANQDGSVYSTRCSAACPVYREDQWQRRSKHTELES